MAQFDICRNLNPDSRVDVPFLVDIQSDLLSALSTAELAGIPRTALGPAVGNMHDLRDQAVAAIDLMITGI
jgi:hypothetical protein